MRTVFSVICILALAILSMPLAEAALITYTTAIPDAYTMLLLGSGLVGLGVYGRRRFKK